VAVAGWLPCGLIFACAALTLGRDEDAMQARAPVQNPRLGLKPGCAWRPHPLCKPLGLAAVGRQRCQAAHAVCDTFSALWGSAPAAVAKMCRFSLELCEGAGVQTACNTSAPRQRVKCAAARRCGACPQERLRRRVAAAVDAPLPGGAAAALGGAPLRPGGEAPAPRPRAVDVEVQVPHALILLTQAPGPGLAKQYSGQPVPLVAGDVPRAERNGAPAGASPV